MPRVCDHPACEGTFFGVPPAGVRSLAGHHLARPALHWVHQARVWRVPPRPLPAAPAYCSCCSSRPVWMRDHESGHLAVLALVTAGTGDCEQEGWRGGEGHVRMRRQEERRRMRRMSSWTLSNRGSSADLTISLFLGNRIDLGPPCSLIAWQQIDEYITPRLLLVRTPPSSSHAEAVPSLELAHEHVGARRNAQHQHHWHKRSKSCPASWRYHCAVFHQRLPLAQ